MMWSKRIGDELYIFRNGEPVYKRWITRSGRKAQPSILLNSNGWPNEWID